MTKSERNAKIVEMTKNGKTQNEIAKELQCSIRTVQRVLNEQLGDISREKSNSTKIGQNGFYITEEMWEDMKDKIDSLLDTIDVQTAKIDKLESNIVSCNELKSSKKYIVKRYTTKEFIAYADEFDLGKYIKIFNVVPITTIENSINNIGQWIDRPDDIIVTYTVENHIDKLNEHMETISDENKTMKRTIREIVE